MNCGSGIPCKLCSTGRSYTYEGFSIPRSQISLFYVSFSFIILLFQHALPLPGFFFLATDIYNHVLMFNKTGNNFFKKLWMARDFTNVHCEENPDLFGPFLWGHWYPCFGLKTSVDSSLTCFLASVQWGLQIHLWCAACDNFFLKYEFIFCVVYWLLIINNYKLCEIIQANWTVHK